MENRCYNCRKSIYIVVEAYSEKAKIKGARWALICKHNRRETSGSNTCPYHTLDSRTGIPF